MKHSGNGDDGTRLVTSALLFCTSAANARYLDPKRTAAVRVPHSTEHAARTRYTPTNQSDLK